MNNWIYTKDELPPLEVSVILCLEYPNAACNKITAGYRHDLDENKFCYYDMLYRGGGYDITKRGVYVHFSDVTKWMYLPE